MMVEIKKVISVTIYSGIILGAVVSLGNKEIFATIVGALVPVLMIWFPEEINDYTLGSTGEGGTIDKPTPEFMISGFGWLLLLGILLVIIFK